MALFNKYFSYFKNVLTFKPKHMKSFMKLFVITTILILGFSCSKDDEGSKEKEEDKLITLEGDYRGSWSSTTDMDITYDNFGISAKLAFSNSTEDRLTGEFFATSSLASCCVAGENDGTLVLDLDGDDITAFRLNSKVQNCTGDFIGSGTITSGSPYTLKINFTGNDCDGNHIGEMVFARTEK